MNDRIKQLMLEAGYAAPEIATRAQKLIELVIKECADAADMAYDADCPFPGDYVVEHMGMGEDVGAATWRCK